MTSELDIYRAAHLLIKRHGDDALGEWAWWRRVIGVQLVIGGFGLRFLGTFV